MTIASGDFPPETVSLFKRNLFRSIFLLGQPPRKNASIAEYQRLIQSPTPRLGRGLGLGSINPPSMNVAGETSGIWPSRFSRDCATHTGILTPVLSTPIYIGASLKTGRSPTPEQIFLRKFARVPASAAVLILPKFSALGPSRSVSCYAFFKGWLPLSQPPECLKVPTSFNLNGTLRP